MDRKRLQTAVHKERRQPSARKKLGLLEKHKDYVQRARNFNGKQTRLKALKEKASFRNEEEFYFGMVEGRTERGVHTASRNRALSTAQARVLKAQDAGYVTMKATSERRKLHRMHERLHTVAAATRPSQHLVFVADDAAAQRFDASAHFDTAPQLLDRHFDRPRRETLRAGAVGARADRRGERAQRDEYRALLGRAQRSQALQASLVEGHMEKQRMGKGKKRKVGDSHCWAAERRR